MADLKASSWIMNLGFNSRLSRSNTEFDLSCVPPREQVYGTRVEGGLGAINRTIFTVVTQIHTSGSPTKIRAVRIPA